MHQQLSRVPLLQARHPDFRKPIFHQQPQNLLRVPPVGLLFAHHRGPDLSGIAQPQLVPALCQQTLEPGVVPASLHPHSHRTARPGTVERLRLLPMSQPFFLVLSRLLVKDRDLLKARVKITAYNQHDVGSFVEPWSVYSQTNLLAPASQRRYAIKQA